jgi:hypothetical protein
MPKKLRVTELMMTKTVILMTFTVGISWETVLRKIWNERIIKDKSLVDKTYQEANLNDKKVAEAASERTIYKND